VNTEASDLKCITFRDGRTLAYAEYGDPDGKLVFYFHGTPGSRLEHHSDDAIARERGARIITADRPGYGHSDFQPHRTFLDWPDDVVQLADALEIERFAVCGWSGGTPHAAACAYKIPDRLTNVCLFSGTALPSASPVFCAAWRWESRWNSALRSTCPGRWRRSGPPLPGAFSIT
jgi:pimeloyl-ACP methyl ester carboxylesterase